MEICSTIEKILFQSTYINPFSNQWSLCPPLKKYEKIRALDGLNFAMCLYSNFEKGNIVCIRHNPCQIETNTGLICFINILELENKSELEGGIFICIVKY